MMDINLENIDDLIAKVIAGEASPEEVTLLETWMAAGEENRLYVEESRKLFAAVERSRDVISVDPELAWQKLDKRIGQGQGAKIISLFRKPSMLRAAASLLLLAMLSFLMYRVLFDQVPVPVVLAARNAVITKDLPDGSKVTVNKNSEITYAVSSKGREVHLKGEAYFEVKHDEEKPFVIAVDEVLIEDIGTAFNVKALPASDVVEVSVAEGEVRFFSKSSPGMLLKAGETAVYHKSGKTFRKVTVKATENTGSYRSRIFYFEETELSEVVRQINEVYGSNIVVKDPALGRCRLSVNFNNEELDLLLSVIAETLDLEISKKGNNIYLNGKPCTQE